MKTFNLLFVLYSIISTISANAQDCSMYSLFTTKQDVGCYGYASGNASVATNIGCQCSFSGCTFVWSNGAVGHTAYDLVAGEYTVTVTTAEGCVLSTGLTITQPEKFVQGYQVQNVTCKGANDGKITITPSLTAGILYYKWSWDSTTYVTNNVVTGLAPGNYSVSVSNAVACELVIDFEIQESESPLLTTVISESSCSDIANGSATANPTGGRAPYQYIWNDPYASTQQTAQNLAVGAFKVTVTDNFGCKTISETQVNAVTANVSASASNLNICPFETVTLTATGAETYTWTADTNVPINNPNASQIQVAPATTTNFTLVGKTTKGCSFTAQPLKITTKPAPIVSIVAPNTLICAGQSAQIIATSNVPAGYSWAPPNGLSSTNTNATMAAPTQTTLYTVTATGLNGCKSTANVTISVDNCSAVQNLPNNDTQISVFPNPTTNKVIYIKTQINTLSTVIVNIYNELGQQVYFKNINSQIGDLSLPIDLNTLNSGIYMITVNVNNEQFTQKIVIN